MPKMDIFTSPLPFLNSLKHAISVTIGLKWLKTFRAHSSISLEHVIFCCLFLDPHLGRQCLNIGVQLRQVIKSPSHITKYQSAI